MRCIYGTVRRGSRLEGNVLLVVSDARVKAQNTCISIKGERNSSYWLWEFSTNTYLVHHTKLAWVENVAVRFQYPQMLLSAIPILLKTVHLMQYILDPSYILTSLYV